MLEGLKCSPGNLAFDPCCGVLERQATALPKQGELDSSANPEVFGANFSYLPGLRPVSPQRGTLKCDSTGCPLRTMMLCQQRFRKAKEAPLCLPMKIGVFNNCCCGVMATSSSLLFSLLCLTHIAFMVYSGLQLTFSAALSVLLFSVNFILKFVSFLLQGGCQQQGLWAPNFRRGQVTLIGSIQSRPFQVLDMCEFHPNHRVFASW